jgi:cytochrome c
MGLAGCQDKAADAPARASAPASADAAPATPSGNGPAKADAPASLSLTGEALARARTCLACHQVDRKQVGPSYRDVAARFADNPDAVTILSNAIRKGGRGQWGAVPMPAQPQVNEAEAAELARWILTLKP